MALHRASLLSVRVVYSLQHHIHAASIEAHPHFPFFGLTLVLTDKGADAYDMLKKIVNDPKITL
jgi:hypothetical protein